MSDVFLLPTDFSDAAAKGVRAGAELAKLLGAKVVIAHVWDSRTMGSPPGTLGWTDAKEQLLQTEIRGVIEKSLEEARSLVPEGVDVETALLESPSAALGLTEHAKEEGVSLIVISTHGRTGLGRILLGSVAEKVVRHAECRVLTVPCRD